jgi:alkanesulfonate monooxygenase
LKFLVAVRPGVTLPLFAARQAVTHDRMSGGRLLVNIATFGDDAEMRADGVSLGHDLRYAQSDEYLTIRRWLMAGEQVGYAGSQLLAEGAELLSAPLQDGGRRFTFAGHRRRPSLSRAITSTGI